MPSSFILSRISSVGSDNRDNAPCNVVPACEPLIPESAMTPIAAAVSSNEIPIICALGAAYFIAYPISSIPAFVLAAASANTSATCPACPASKPNPRKALDATSDANPKPAPLEAAKSSIPGIAVIISSTLKPALARFSMPSAASFAENDVEAPSLRATSFKTSNCSLVAPDIALTRDICASYSFPVSIAVFAKLAKGAVIASERLEPKSDNELPILLAFSDISFKLFPILASPLMPEKALFVLSFKSSSFPPNASTCRLKSLTLSSTSIFTEPSAIINSLLG